MITGAEPKIAAAVLSYLPKAMGVAKKVYSAIDDAMAYSIRSSHIDYATAVVQK